MNKIEVKILNPEVLQQAKQMLVTSARLTQRGHNVKTMEDFLELYNKSFEEKTYRMMCALPHGTIKRFAAINVVIVGASRRFLAQITRHQAGFTYTSASLQYSDYSDNADFCVPYDILQKGPEAINTYLEANKLAMRNYEEIIKQQGIDHDAAGYMAPQGLRNVLIISGNPLAFCQMLTARTCRRNTKETQYVALRIWEELYKLDPILFGKCGPDCCHEGKFTCGRFCNKLTPTQLLQEDFPLLMGDKNES